MKKKLRIGAEMWLPVGLVLAWWFLSAKSTSVAFPPLSQIIAAFHDLWLFENFRSDIVPSLEHLVLGLAIAATVGISLGTIFGIFPALYDSLKIIFDWIRATPGVALLPVTLLIFGPGDHLKVAIIAVGTFWPIFLSTIDGVRSLDLVARDTASTLHLRRRDYLLRVLLPSASPQIVAGLRLALPLGVTLIVASEFMASTNGIGYQELLAAQTFQTANMWAALILLGLLGYTLNLASRLVERRILAWHIGYRASNSRTAAK